MERGMMGNYHVPCEVGEKGGVPIKVDADPYLSPLGR